MSTILLTGFEPFGGEATNPSWEAVAPLQGTTVASHRIETARLPTAFGHGRSLLLRAIARHEPTLVLCVGQAGGRAAISLERIAVNLIDARIPDNRGRQPVDRPVVRGGPEAYLTRLPLKAMRARLIEAGIPCELSLSAGSFVCNEIAYALAHHIATQAPRLRGGFVHIPYSPAQAARHPGAPGMTVDLVTEGLRLLAEAALRTRRELRVAGGRED
jgi:pyroglutamyl-peptidase